jgi:hypothetical protein
MEIYDDFFESSPDETLADWINPEDMMHPRQESTLIGQRYAAGFINGTLEGPALLLDDVFYCCELGCHLIAPLFERNGDGTFRICAKGPSGIVFVDLVQTQALCLVGLDHEGKCLCRRGGDDEG